MVHVCDWHLISGEGDCGEGDCGEGDCGEGDCGEGDCGEGDCGEGEWLSLDRSSFKSYDESLSKLVDITLIERVEYDAKASKEDSSVFVMKERRIGTTS